MPAKSPKLSIKLDLLKPQSSPEKLPVKFFRWLLSSGRFMFIFVEALVLLAFITRFKLDADLATRKEDIEGQIPYIESLKSYEILIKQTQLKITTIKTFYETAPDYSQILKNISGQTPLGVKIVSLNLEKGIGKVTVGIIAQAQTNNELSSFLAGLKEAGFSAVTLTSAGLEAGVTRFTISADASTQSTGGFYE